TGPCPGTFLRQRPAGGADTPPTLAHAGHVDRGDTRSSSAAANVSRAGRCRRNPPEDWLGRDRVLLLRRPAGPEHAAMRLPRRLLRELSALRESLRLLAKAQRLLADGQQVVLKGPLWYSSHKVSYVSYAGDDGVHGDGLQTFVRLVRPWR